MDSQGNAVIAGRYWNGAAHGDDILAMKFDAADGDILWMKTFDGPAHLDDRGWNLLIGPEDDPVITGMVQTSTADASFLTVKLNGTTGSTIWQQLLTGAINNPDDRSGWLAPADGGDVILVNKVWLPSLGYEVLVHRFAAGNGAQVWHQVHGSAGAVADEPRAAIGLSSGDVAVAGTHAGDYLAMRIRATDGTVAWTSGYNGPPGWYDSAGCLAEGLSGEVIAGGFSSGSTTGWDAVTVAFDPADGDTLWHVRYDAGVGETDEVAALAVGPLGSLFAVGYSFTLATNSDLLSLAYSLGLPPAGLDGAPVGSPASQAPGIAVWPNPSRGPVEFGVTLASPATVRLAIFDLAGRERARVQSVMLAAGTARLAWDGRDAAGRSLEPGIYLARVEGAEVAITRKVVVAR